MGMGKRLTPAADHPPGKQQDNRANRCGNKRPPEAEHRHFRDFGQLGADERAGDADQDVGEDAWSDEVTRSAIQPAMAPISSMVKKPTPGWLKNACASINAPQRLSRLESSGSPSLAHFNDAHKARKP